MVRQITYGFVREIFSLRTGNIIELSEYSKMPELIAKSKLMKVLAVFMMMPAV
jgi:predicted thioredoxin/glutaredoxin